MKEAKHYKLIACEIMFREICLCASQCTNIIDITFMPKGLHDIGESKMSEKLQLEINQVDTEKYDAILLCYALCNNGVRSLNSKIPLVIPRAHDCITLLLGTRNRYNEYFNNNPGTYFKSSGWIERELSPVDNEESIAVQLGLNKTYNEYVELYGEENAEYLYEMLGNGLKNYKKITFIDTKTGNVDLYRDIAKKQAYSNNWEYEEIDGDIRLISNLLEGEWNEDEFLIVPPDNIITPTYDESIVTYIPK